MKRHRSKIAALGCFIAGNAFALDNTPVVRMDASGGQIFLSDKQGSNTSLSGSADWLFGDGLRFSDNDTVIPSLTGQYLRRAQVNQIAGGGTLTTETLDDSAAVRWVHSWGSWDIKPNANFKNELVTISNQESLGAGVLDLDQGGAGIEAEWKGNGGILKSLRQDLTFTRDDYYHYDRNSSPFFGVELLSNNQALNFYSYDYTIVGDFALWDRGLVTVSGEATHLVYPYQKILEPGSIAGSSASFIASNRARSDWVGTGLVSVTQQIPKMGKWISLEGSASLTMDYVVLASDQNDFDEFQSGSVAQFNPDYYSYGEYSIGPVISLVVGDNLRANISYNYAHRKYRDRPVQDSGGVYASGGKVYSDTQTLSYAFSYPLGKGFDAQVSGGYVLATSNMRFESFYLYNYSYPYYFLGFGYAL